MMPIHAEFPDSPACFHGNSHRHFAFSRSAFCESDRDLQVPETEFVREVFELYLKAISIAAERSHIDRL
jgi:hypothetical protein